MKSHFFLKNLVKFRALRGRTNAAQPSQNLSIRGTRIDRFCEGWARESGAGRLRIGAAAGRRQGRWSREGRRQGGNAVGEHKEGVEKTIGVLPPLSPQDGSGDRRQGGSGSTRRTTAAGHQATGGGLLHPIPAAGDRQQGRRIDTATDGSRAARGSSFPLSRRAILPRYKKDSFVQRAD